METRRIDSLGSPCLFAADVHLSHEAVEKADRFMAWMESLRNRGPCHLFILGDLFDSWFPGIDRLFPFYGFMKGRLADCAKHTPIHFAAGNRDFHLVSDLRRLDQGIDAIDGVYEVILGSRRIHASHGDELCVNDKGYQRYKQFIRSSPMRLIAHMLPNSLKRIIVDRMAAGSRAHIDKTRKAELEVPMTAYDELLLKYDAVVHGHTHPLPGQRPGTLSSHVCVLSPWESPDDVLIME